MNIYSDAIEQLGIFTIVGGILAIVATVLAYVFIVPEKRREKLNAFGKFLHDTCNFKYLIVEKILQALYIFFTADMIILGFFMLFAAPKDYFGNRHWLGVYGILTMILGPIMIRLVYLVVGNGLHDFENRLFTVVGHSYDMWLWAAY